MTIFLALQQLVISIFDKVVSEDGRHFCSHTIMQKMRLMFIERALEVPAIDEAPSGKGTIPVRAAAFDAYRVRGSALKSRHRSFY